MFMVNLKLQNHWKEMINDRLVYGCTLKRKIPPKKVNKRGFDVKINIRDEQRKFLELIKDYTFEKTIEKKQEKKQQIDILYASLVDKLPVESTERRAIDRLYEITQ